MEENISGNEEMHHCDVKPMLENYLKLNHFLSATFAVVVVSIGALFAVIDMKLTPVIDNVKRNELRASRLESELISSNKNTGDKLGLMIQGINKLNNNFSNLKYIYATNDRLDAELKKKVDYSRIDKRNLKD